MAPRLNIKLVLACAFLALFAGFGILGWRSLDNLVRTNSSVTEMMRHWMPTIDLANSIGDGLARLRVAESDHILSTSRPGMLHAHREMQRIFSALETDQAAFSSFLSSDEEWALLAEFRARFSNYVARHDQIIEASERGDKAAAAQAFTRTMAEFDELMMFVSRISALKQVEAGKAYGASQDAYQVARRDTFVLWTLGLLVVLAATIFIVFGISRPLMRLAAVMGRLAQGDLAVAIPFVSRGNEIGDVARTLAVFQLGLAEAEKVRARQAEIDREATARLERRAWTLGAHAAAAAALASAGSEDELITQVCQAIATQEAFSLALVGLAGDDDGKTVRIVCAEGPSSGYAEDLRLSWSEDDAAGRGATGDCIRTGVPQVVPVGAATFGGHHDRASSYGFQSACVLPLKDGDKTFGVLNVYSPTTGLFDAEMVEHLEHLADQLAFGILSRASRRAQEELEQSLFQARKLETLGRLAGGVAHDFNNLLAAVLGFSEFIIQDQPADHPSNRHARRIQSAAYRGKALVEQILAFTRQSEIKRNRFALADMVGETISLLQPLIPPSLQFRSDIVVADMMVEADKGQLGQVLMNLCVNSRDAMAGQSGTIVIAMDDTDMTRPIVARLATTVAGAVEVWTDPLGDNWAISGNIQPHGRHVSLTVSDSGPGMAAEVLDRAFEPFFTTKGRDQGSGLGLAVVQGMVLNHGGAVVVRSRPGCGTDVEVILPALEEQREAPQASPLSRQTAPAHGRLLLVDDDPDASDPVAEALRRRGWSVTQCARAVDALDILAQDFGFQIVLSDQIMPGMPGTELVSQIKARHPELPCVLYTGYDERLDDRAAEECGASGLLSKPLDFTTLSDYLVRHARQ